MSDAVEAIVERRVRSCKTEIDTEVHTIRADVASLHGRVDELSSDVHRITIAVGDISNSLRSIATAVEKLSDLPETWDKIKGFWSVMSWLRSNFVPLTTLIVVLVWVATHSGFSDVLEMFK